MYKVNTGLYHFIIPQKLVNWDTNEIQTTSFLDNEEGWIYTELAAQTAGLHVRLCDNLKHQVCLMKMKSSPFISERATGEAEAVARLLSRSAKAFDYEVEVITGSTKYKFELIIALQDYADEEEQSRITQHFRKVIACLT